MMNKQLKILIASGGTGGHVIPAYSLASYLIKNKNFVELVTDIRGLKFLENYKELNLTINNSSTIFKSNIFKIPFALLVIIGSFIKSFLILKKLKPNIVFGMGGHSSFTICLAAKILKIPLIIYESNLFLGKSNKYLLPYADKIFIAYNELEGVKKKFQHKKIFVGNIIREEILNFKKIKEVESSKDLLNILVLGGSQAAKSFGENLPIIFENCLKKNIKLKIFQQCTIEQIPQLKKTYEEFGIEFELFNYKENLIEYFNLVDFVITRSGASIMSELLNCSIPFVAIPYPHAADDHQKKNALYFKNKGYCFLIDEEKIHADLFNLIQSINRDKNLLKQMIHQQNKHSDKEVFNIINNNISRLLND